MDAYILCDASYDLDTLMGTVAGYINFGSETIEFVKRLTEVRDSSSAELEAIFYSLKELNALCVRLNASPSAICIGSDSMTAISNLEPGAFPMYGSGNGHYADAVNRIKCSEELFNAKVSYVHVKAHQKIKVATQIEQMHNKVDRLARAELIQFRKDVFGTKVNKSLYYGVCVDRVLNDKDKSNYFRIGYQLAKRGYKARFYYDEVSHSFNEHPLYQGINQFAQEVGMPIADYLQIVTWSDDTTQSALTHGAIGLDRVYVRAYYQEKLSGNRQDLANVDYNTRSCFQGGAAARLLFGLQEQPLFDYEEPSCRVEVPSKFVLIDTQKNKGGTVCSWLTRVSKLVNIPLYRSMTEVNERFGLCAIKMSENKFYGACVDRLPRYGDEQHYFRIGYSLAEMGYIARIHNTSNDADLWGQNPLYKGICAYALENAIDPSSLIECIYWSDDFTKPDIMDCAVGLDGMLLDHYLNRERLKEVWVNESSNSYRAGAATRLLMGPQQLRKKKGRLPLLREDNPSEFVIIDTCMTRKNSVFSWLMRFKDIVDIPFYCNASEFNDNIQILKSKKQISLLACA